MKNLKRLFGILLILVTMLCLLPVTASAANPESDFKYITNAAYAYITDFISLTDSPPTEDGDKF